MNKRFIGALLVAGLTISSFVGSAALAPSAEAATKTFTLSITKIANTNLKVGNNAVFSGKVTPASKAKNSKVTLQVRKSTSSSWKTVKTIKLNGSAKFSNQAVKVSGAGTWYYRICNTSAKGLKGACSPAKKVTVKAAAVKASSGTVPAKYQGGGAKNKMSWSQYQKAVTVAKQLVAPLRGLSLEAQLEGVAEAVGNIAAGAKYGQNLSHYADPYGLLVLGHYTCSGTARTVGLLLDQLGIKWTHINPNSQTHQWVAVTYNGQSYIVDGMAGIAIRVSNPKVYPNGVRICKAGAVYQAC